jgi:hypothetical protein
MHPNCPLWRHPYREEKHSVRGPLLDLFVPLGSCWYAIVIEECMLIGDLRCPRGSVGAHLCPSCADHVFHLPKTWHWGQGTVEATAPLFGAIAGTFPEREPARLSDAQRRKIQETGHIYCSRMSVPFAVRSSCPIIESPCFFKAIRVVPPTRYPAPSLNFNRSCGGDVAQ